MHKIVRFSLLAFLGGIAAAGGASYAYFANEFSAREAELALEIEQAASVETAFYTRLPIYDDFRTAAREAELRRHLLADHLQVAQAVGVQPPAHGLKRLTERLQQVLNRYGDYPPIKIALSSVIRPAAYQESLRRSNANASLVSSHSYGVSFDIFYDDFFVDLPGDDPALEPLRLRMGFLLGRSLRRQFHAVLAETLLELQSDGKVYVIWERNQRCYHVTVLPEG